MTRLPLQKTLWSFLQSRHDGDGSRHLFAGDFNQNRPVSRNRRSKYFVPYKIQKSDVYALFLTGFGLLSRCTASLVYKASQSVALHPMEDIYLGMCVAKAGLVLMSHSGVKQSVSGLSSGKVDKLDPCLYKDMLYNSLKFSFKNYILWSRMHNPTLKCVL